MKWQKGGKQCGKWKLGGNIKLKGEIDNIVESRNWGLKLIQLYKSYIYL